MMKLISLITLAVSMITMTSCNAQSSGDANGQEGVYQVLNVDQYDKQIKSGEVLIVDVRTPNEYNSGHIEGAVLCDVTAGSFDQKIQEYAKDQPVYIYCRSGSRSAGAMRKMKAMGFTEVYDLRGGVINWTKSGKPLTK
jgi:rhodanese-related sulfurtransferase